MKLHICNKGAGYRLSATATARVENVNVGDGYAASGDVELSSIANGPRVSNISVTQHGIACSEWLAEVLARTPRVEGALVSAAVREFAEACQRGGIEVEVRE